jgi:hypothetical protein
MTQPLTHEQVAEIRAKALKATAGPWDVDIVHNEGTYGTGEDDYTGFNSYVVGCGPVNDWKSIVDTSNSNVAMIEVDGDSDGTTAWDEIGRRNAEFIAAANPENILSLIATIEAAQAENAKLKALMELKLPCDVKLPPVTTIKAGCTVETLVAGIRARITYAAALIKGKS